MMPHSWEVQAGLAALAYLVLGLTLSTSARAQDPPDPQYPRVNLALGYRGDAAWPRERSAYAWGPMAGMAVDAEGLIWTVNRGEMPVQVYTPDGRMVREWGKGALGRAHQISIGPRGHIWLPDLDAHTVIKFSPEGKRLLTLGTEGKPGSDKQTFNKPTDVAETPEGDIFVADGYGNNRIVHFDKDGRYVNEWGGLGVLPGQFSLPHAIALDSKGKLYVADRNNARVQVFDQSGKFLTEWRNLCVPWTIRITPQDEVYLCGTSPSQWNKEDVQLGIPPKDQLVMRLTTDGRVLSWWMFPYVLRGEKETKTQPGELSWVHGVAMDKDGNFYLGDVMGNRAQKFVPVEGPVEEAAQ